VLGASKLQDSIDCISSAILIAMNRLVLYLLVCGTTVLCACADKQSDQSLPAFDRVVIDGKGPIDPWGKSVGDINGDGKVDLIVGGHEGQGLVWYQNPSWDKHVISSSGSFGTDHEVADIDGDGRKDVVSLTSDGLVWYRNVADDDWAQESIDQMRLHDVEVADLDGDGQPDLIARGQTAFAGTGHLLSLYFRRGRNWQRATIDVPKGEGLKVADLDADGAPDIVLNGHWLKNPGVGGEEWKLHRFAANWTWEHTFIDVGDVNGDGRPDIVLAPAEPAGGAYRISWFESPRDAQSNWPEHVLADHVETTHHFVGLADFDRDGKTDVATAAMHQSKEPAAITLYLNNGAGTQWVKRLVAPIGSHNMRILDIDGDGDPDLFGANWSGPDQKILLWVNQTCSPSTACTAWRRHVIDPQRPGKALFIEAADVDGDGHLDLGAGGSWYRNPGRCDGKWIRHAFGEPANNLVAFADLDGDGDTDAILSRWKEGNEDAGFVYAENQGTGDFRLRTDLPAGAGDFLQGRALAQFSSASAVQIALSWHKAGQGIEMLTIPERPMAAAWKIERVAEASQDEALSRGDIDRDGRIDLLLGTIWLRNSPEGWHRHVIDPERLNPDRNRLADMNGDGRLDAVVGFEAISKNGEVIWYEQGANATQVWTPHLIGTAIGPMSLDVTDFDWDGDPDVVVGEHNLAKPDTARLLMFENLDGRGSLWREHVLHIGDEHHDGAIAVDIDRDGDIDIVSIGWGHNRVLIYENLSANRGQHGTKALSNR